MVNVTELLELKFGNPMKQLSSNDQVKATDDLINEVRVKGVERGEVSNPNVIEGFDGKMVKNDVNDVFEGLEQIGNELNEINLVVDLSMYGISENVGSFDGKGIDLVVDLSPNGGSDRKFGSGNGSKGSLGGNGEIVPYGDDSKYNGVIGDDGKCWDDHMGKEGRTDVEGNYEVNDLVWGKVKNHLWWPGQVFDLNSASKKARQCIKKDGFLIAYFGDESFAWAFASEIKPFRKHFSQMVEQSNSEAFCHAVECALREVSRRVELGLACSCLSEDMFAKIKSQVAVNAGISKDSRRRDGGDRFSSASTFEPAILVENVKALAVDPFSGSGRLESVKARAQLSAYHRWKGYCQLSKQALLNASTTRDIYMRESKHLSIDGVGSGKKVEHLSELTTEGCLNIQDKKLKSGKRGRKRKAVDSVSNDSSDGSGTMEAKAYKPGESTHRIARIPSGSTLSIKNGDKGSENPVSRSSGKPNYIHNTIPRVSSKESPGSEIVPATYPPSDEILSQLYLAATDPLKESNSLTSLVHFFSEFRSYSVEISNKKEVSGVYGFEDSYWTDRIIQIHSEEQVLFEPEVVTLSSNPENKFEECSETALILNFNKKSSVPSETSLNDLYTKYGSLKEVSTKNKRAKVVFEKRSDAETAFSNAGKCSVFGPSLLNCSLDYSPTPPRRISTRGRKQRKLED